ncbi:unnamed protein product [Ambrosiozyma monospora]|uniref:Unnamed protein product n=1 Tax=Ambrosiozyma monospora TaxID=43982 RepID=A0A9W6YUS2_AMBMO|nr:unnamed protein product [Ambrosiozyma monospora]
MDDVQSQSQSQRGHSNSNSKNKNQQNQVQQQGGDYAHSIDPEQQINNFKKPSLLGHSVRSIASEPNFPKNRSTSYNHTIVSDSVNTTATTGDFFDTVDYLGGGSDSVHLDDNDTVNDSGSAPAAVPAHLLGSGSRLADGSDYVSVDELKQEGGLLNDEAAVVLDDILDDEGHLKDDALQQEQKQKLKETENFPLSSGSAFDDDDTDSYVKTKTLAPPSISTTANSNLKVKGGDADKEQLELEHKLDYPQTLGGDMGKFIAPAAAHHNESDYKQDPPNPPSTTTATNQTQTANSAPGNTTTSGAQTPAPASSLIDEPLENEFIKPQEVITLDQILNKVNDGEPVESLAYDAKTPTDPASSTFKTSIDVKEPQVPDSAIEIDSENTVPAAVGGRDGSLSRLSSSSLPLSQTQAQDQDIRSAQSPFREGTGTHRPHLARGESYHSGVSNDEFVPSIHSTTSASVHSTSSAQSVHSTTAPLDLGSGVPLSSAANERKPRHDPSSVGVDIGSGVGSKIRNESSLSYLRKISRSRSRASRTSRVSAGSGNSRRGGEEGDDLDVDVGKGTKGFSKLASMESDLDDVINNALLLVEENSCSVEDGGKIVDCDGKDDIVRSLHESIGESVGVKDDDVKEKKVDVDAKKPAEDDKEEGDDTLETKVESIDTEAVGKKVVEAEKKPETTTITTASKSVPVSEDDENKKTVVVDDDVEEVKSTDPLDVPTAGLSIVPNANAATTTQEKEASAAASTKSTSESTGTDVTVTDSANDVDGEDKGMGKVIEKKLDVGESTATLAVDVDEKATETASAVEKSAVDSDKKQETDADAEAKPKAVAAAEKAEVEVEAKAEAEEPKDKEEQDEFDLLIAAAQKEREEQAKSGTLHTNYDDEIERLLLEAEQDKAQAKARSSLSNITAGVKSTSTSTSTPTTSSLSHITAGARAKSSNPLNGGSVHVPKPDKMTFEDEPVYVYTSLAGGFQIMTRTNRLTTILTANRIKFEYRDLGTDEEAKKVWRRYCGGKTLPGVVRGKDDYIGNWEEIEEANENYEVRSLVYESY